MRSSSRRIPAEEEEDLDILLSPTTSLPKVTRLSQLHDGAHWQEKPNACGETPTIDFAFSEPFRFFTPQALAALNNVVDNHLDQVQRTPRSTFLRGVAAMEPLLDVSRLARVCSSLIGILVRPHALRREWTHVNVQLEVQDRPVDSFHYDYVPFVFVTMLRKAPGDGTGALVLDIGGRGGKRNKKDGKERTEEEGGGAEIFLPIRLAVGESVLVQGSHVRHQANQSLAGCRVSLVVSLMPASVLHVDMTRIRLHSLPLGEGEGYFQDAVQYRTARVRALCHLLQETQQQQQQQQQQHQQQQQQHDHHFQQQEQKTRMWAEFRRWLNQFEGCSSKHVVDVRVVLLVAEAYYNS